MAGWVQKLALLRGLSSGETARVGPFYVTVDISRECNLHCPGCAFHSLEIDKPAGRNRTPAYMPWSLFSDLCDALHRMGTESMTISGGGEPFLNPAIYEMIAYARSHGIRLISSTNGHCLKDPRKVEELIRSGLDALIVAVDGTTQETYELYRRPGTLDSVLEGVRTLAERKRSLEAELPRINIRFVVSRQNEHEIPGMVELARSCGADMLSLKTMNPLTKDPYGLDPRPQDDSDDPFVPTDPRYRRFRYRDGGKTRIRVQENPCRRLWNNPKIHSDGSVCMCTCDVAGRFPMGNLHTESLRQIWMSASYRQQRRQFRADWEKMAPCCTCTYAYEGGSCIDEIICDAVFFDAPGNLTAPG